MYPFRVFISYSREDQNLVAKIADRFRVIGARPIWDKDLQPGSGIHDEIKTKIAHAHFFVPVLTPRASKRPWVHQEIGYALALGVPVLPLQLGKLPEGLAEQLHALSIHPDLRDLNDQLKESVLDELMATARHRTQPLYSCAYLPEQRTRLIVDSARAALRTERRGCKLRMKAALTPFSLPAVPGDDPLWDLRDGKFPRGMEGRQWASDERMTLQDHARGAGCDLLIYPEIGLTRGRSAYKFALQTLRKFLGTMPDKKARVIVRKGNPDGELHIVGDLYLVESLAPRPGFGFMQTMCTRHTPTILDRIQRFDDEFELALRNALIGSPPGSSRRVALQQLDQLIARLEK